MVSRVDPLIYMHKKINASVIILGLLIATGIGLRLWRLPELFHFTYDEEIIAFVGKRMFLNGHIPLIGGVTPMHVHLAPYFYWLSGFLLFLSKFNPLGWGMAAAILSGFTMLLLYKLGSKLFGKRVGIISVLLYGFSFYQNIFDRHWWGLAFDGFISIGVLFCLWKIFKQKEKFSYLLALLLAYGFHTDPSTLTLLVLTLLAFVVMRLRVTRNTLIKACLIFLISFLPLLLFDLRHNFSNSRGIFQYAQEIKAAKTGIIKLSPIDVLLFPPRALARLIFVFGDTNLATQYAYCSAYSTTRISAVPTVAALIVFLLYAWLILKAGQRKNPDRQGLKLLLLLPVSLYVGLVIYAVAFKGDLFDHYLATVFPVFLLSLAYALAILSRKSPALVGTLLFIFSVVNTYQLATVEHEYGYADKTKAIQWAIATTGQEDFSLDVLGECFRFNGYRYLFLLNGKEPTKSYVDANLSYLYDQAPAVIWPRYLALIGNPNFPITESYQNQYNFYNSGLISKAKFGNIDVMVIDNLSGEYRGNY